MINIIKKIKNIFKKELASSGTASSRSGFVILFAVTLASILLAIALGISNVALNEVNFSASVKESDNAFYAADTGAECALYNDETSSNSFVQSGGTGNITCLNSTVPITQSGSLPLLSWVFKVANMSSAGGSCAIVTLTRDFTNPSYPISVLDSQGYNVGDGSCNSSNTNRTEREVQLNYSVATIPFTNGACFATHYACSDGTSINNVDAVSSWTWSCSGYSGGSTASCSENKVAGFSQTGATETTGGGYTIDTFTSGGTFTVSGASGNVDYLVVGGGGGGGAAYTGAGGSGGGGGGGVKQVSSFVLAPGTYTIVVGAGGAGAPAGGASPYHAQGSSGGVSSAFGTSVSGGGGGGGYQNITDSIVNGLAGGSGGGAGGGSNVGPFGAGGAGTAGQGNSGGNGNGGIQGAGGGGAGGAGASASVNGGNGGAGASSSYSGGPVFYGAGGGGGGNNTAGTGGSSCGGNGQVVPPVGVAAGNGTAGQGCGGGGGYGQSPKIGGNGGSGVVIIRHL
jgi:hypothetical protein